MQEIWREVTDYEEFYEVSNLGRVRSKGRTITKKSRHGGYMVQTYKAKPLNGNIRHDNYIYFHLSKDGKAKQFCIAVLVLKAFIGPRPDGQEACHNDGKPLNNILDNLRWDTHVNNNQDRKRHGTYFMGEKHPSAKLTAESVSEIISSKEKGIDLAKKFKVKPATISAIRHGRNWKSSHKLGEDMVSHEI